MFFWIYDTPNVVVALIFMVVFVAINTAGIVSLRKLVRRWLGGAPGENDLVGNVLSAFGGVYGLLLGLVAVGAYTNFSDADSKVGQEAASLGSLYRDISAYPEPVRSQLQGQLKEYCRYVIDEAWPLQRKGIVPKGGTERVNEFQKTLTAFEPTTAGQQVIHAEALRQFNQFVQIRRQRLQSVTGGLPPVLWGTILIGAFLIMAITWCLVVDNLSAHIALTGVMAAFIGMVIFLIAAMDYPFRGELSVGPDAFELVQSDIMGVKK